MASETLKILDRLSKKLADDDGYAASDYRIAKVLMVSRTTVSNWRVGKGSFSDATALKVAEILGENPGYMLALAAAERATSETERKAWATAAKHLQRSAAAVLMVVFIALPIANTLTTTSVYYVKLWMGFR
jgi:plasmid maintenance system antidote protein VapI